MDNNIKIGSNRSFGIVFFVVFILIGFYPLLKDGNLNIISILIGIIFLILGILNSRFLTPLNKIWFKFGIFLGQIISPIVMGIIFFFSSYSNCLYNESFRKGCFEIKKKK